jgi:hypothetical protein
MFRMLTFGQRVPPSTTLFIDYWLRTRNACLKQASEISQKWRAIRPVT